MLPFPRNAGVPCLPAHLPSSAETHEEKHMKASLPRACAALVIAGLTTSGGSALAAEHDKIALTGVEWTGEPAGGISVDDDTDDAGNAIRSLTAPPEGAVDYWPSWSPDGSQLVFLRFDYTGPALYRVDADGGNLTRLVGGTDIDSFGTAPLWGPRGANLIAFVDNNDSCAYVMSPDGGNRRQVSCPGEVRQWFPDGRHLLVSVRSPDDSTELRRVDVATGGATSLGSLASWPARVSISPDGERIALDDGSDAIDVLDVATGVRRFLTAGRSPVFSADGGRIAFQKTVGTSHPLFVIDADGGNARQVTPVEPGDTYTPIEWSVDGSEVLVAAKVSDGDLGDAFNGIVRVEDGSVRARYSGRVYGLGYPNSWFEQEEAAVALENRAPLRNLAGAQGSERLYKVVLPAGIRKLRIAASGGSGDVSLYVSQGKAPTPDEAQYWSAHGGTNDEAVTIAAATAGVYYVKVVGEQAYAGVSLRASCTR